MVHSARKLTVGMATYDDFDGVYFTIQSIQVFHPEVASEIEFLIIDNRPNGPEGEALRHFSNTISNCYYFPNVINQGTASRDRVFRYAKTPYVLCVDSHVLIVPGALRLLIDYLDAHPTCPDLLQGPLLYDDVKSISTHFAPVWSAGMYGVWETDPRGVEVESPPFDIPMQGLGIFCCGKAAWPGFNSKFSGFGGEEGYIHEKFRQNGGRTICLPFLRWVHRFQRPDGVTYPNSWKDRIRNYMIGFDELQLDSRPVVDHFREHIGSELTDDFVKDIKTEIAGPFFYFDAIYCINLDSATERWQAMQRRFEALGIAHRVRRFPAFETTIHHIGCALSHRAILQDAYNQDLQNVLVFEDDAIFLDQFEHFFTRIMGELRQIDWQLLYLGAHTWGEKPAAIADCKYLVRPTAPPTCTHAIAYNNSVFTPLLQELPACEEQMNDWIAIHLGIDQYLGKTFDCLLTQPVIASQPFLLAQKAPALQDRYTLGDVQPFGLEHEQLTEIFRMQPGYTIRVLEDKVRVFSKQRSHFVSLNATAGLILDLVDGKRSVEQIMQVLQAAFPEAAATIPEEVSRTLAFLRSQNILKLAQVQITS